MAANRLRHCSRRCLTARGTVSDAAASTRAERATASPSARSIDIAPRCGIERGRLSVSEMNRRIGELGMSRQAEECGIPSTTAATTSGPHCAIPPVHAGGRSDNLDTSPSFASIKPTASSRAADQSGHPSSRITQPSRAQGRADLNLNGQFVDVHHCVHRPVALDRLRAPVNYPGLPFFASEPRDDTRKLYRSAERLSPPCGGVSEGEDQGYPRWVDPTCRSCQSGADFRLYLFAGTVRGLMLWGSCVRAPSCP